MAEATIDVVGVAMDRPEQRQLMTTATRAAWNDALGRARDRVRADLTGPVTPCKGRVWAQVASMAQSARAAWQSLQHRRAEPKPMEYHVQTWKKLRDDQRQPMMEVVTAWVTWADEMMGRLMGTTSQPWVQAMRLALKRGEQAVAKATLHLVASDAMAEMTCATAAEAIDMAMQVAAADGEYREKRDREKEAQLDAGPIVPPRLVQDARARRWENARTVLHAEREGTQGGETVRSALAVHERGRELQTQRRDDGRRRGAAGSVAPTMLASERAVLDVRDLVRNEHRLAEAVVEGLRREETPQTEWDVKETYLEKCCPMWSRTMQDGRGHRQKARPRVRVQSGDWWDVTLTAKMIDGWLAGARAIHGGLRRMARDAEGGQAIGQASAAVARVIENYVAQAVEWQLTSATYAVETAVACHELAQAITRHLVPEVRGDVETWLKAGGQEFAGRDDEILAGVPSTLQEMCKAANRLVIADRYEASWRNHHAWALRDGPQVPRAQSVATPWSLETHTLTRASMAEAVEHSMKVLLNMVLAMSRTMGRWVPRLGWGEALLKRTRTVGGPGQGAGAATEQRERTVAFNWLSGHPLAGQPDFTHVNRVEYDWKAARAAAASSGGRVAPMMMGRAQTRVTPRRSWRLNPVFKSHRRRTERRTGEAGDEPEGAAEEEEPAGEQADDAEEADEGDEEQEEEEEAPAETEEVDMHAAMDVEQPDADGGGAGGVDERNPGADGPPPKPGRTTSRKSRGFPSHATGAPETACHPRRSRASGRCDRSVR